MTAERQPAGWKSQAKFIAGLIVVVLLLIVMFQNVAPTEFNVLFWQPQLPRCLLPLVAFLMGAVVGAVAAYLVLRRRGARQ